MTRRGEISLSDYILDEKFTKIFKYDYSEAYNDFIRTNDQESIILAVNKASKNIEPEITAIVIGAIITVFAVFPEVRAIIRLFESEQPYLLSNGIEFGGAFIAIFCGFIIQRTFELIGILRFRKIATEYLKNEQPKLSPDLYKSAKIIL